MAWMIPVAEEALTSTLLTPLVSSRPRFLNNQKRALRANIGNGLNITKATNKSQTSGHVVGCMVSFATRAKEK
jgi:hypothetical protein